MICQKCKNEGQKSTVTVGPCFTTAMASRPFYDEEGTYHNHDGNVTTTSYSCSRGHSFTVRERLKCPGCTWPTETHEGGSGQWKM
jgi:hypothetical protein